MRCPHRTRFHSFRKNTRTAWPDESHLRTECISFAGCEDSALDVSLRVTEIVSRPRAPVQSVRFGGRILSEQSYRIRPLLARLDTLTAH